MFLQSISVYLILMLFMMLCGIYAAKKENKYKSFNGEIIIERRSFWNIEIIFPLIVFAVVMGMRYDVGTDYFSYLYNYLDKTYSGKGEILFNLFSDVGWYLNLHYTVFFAAIAFTQILFFFLAFKDERYLFPFLIFFLFTNGNFLFLMNVLRQALAMCIWLYAIRFIDIKKKYVYFLICVALFMIHRSSIILFIFYPILTNNKDYFESVKLQLILFFSAFIFKLLFSSIIIQLDPIINFYTSLLGDGLYDSYSVSSLVSGIVESEGSGIAKYFKILLNLIIILYSTNLKKYYNSNRFIIIYFFFFLGVITTYIFPDGAISLSRPFRYFYIFQPIMYSYFLYYLYKKKIIEKNFLLLVGIIILFACIFLLSQYSATENSHSLYQFYFQKLLLKEYPN
ncbi:EpsG family protein [Chryseobacterium aahli]|uniref:EpsG family protein n=1 Tax=Chryseobacterium aahli TaxID=1278643 RepID=UPI001F61351A|nr:EpsG family protein [Chryseobacterium aahli]MCI3936494.1 EpsG family protein [Chryseobacterium aahli]